MERDEGRRPAQVFLSVSSRFGKPPNRLEDKDSGLPSRNGAAENGSRYSPDLLAENKVLRG